MFNGISFGVTGEIQILAVSQVVTPGRVRLLVWFDRYWIDSYSFLQNHISSRNAAPLKDFLVPSGCGWPAQKMAEETLKTDDLIVVNLWHCVCKVCLLTPNYKVITQLMQSVQSQFIVSRVS